MLISKSMISASLHVGWDRMMHPWLHALMAKHDRPATRFEWVCSQPHCAVAGQPVNQVGYRVPAPGGRDLQAQAAGRMSGLYAADIALWSEYQADLLRRRADGQRQVRRGVGPAHHAEIRMVCSARVRSHAVTSASSGTFASITATSRLWNCGKARSS